MISRHRSRTTRDKWQCSGCEILPPDPSLWSVSSVKISELYQPLWSLVLVRHPTSRFYHEQEQGGEHCPVSSVGISSVCFYVVDILYISIEHHIYIIYIAATGTKYRVFSVLGDVESIFRLTNKHVDEQSCAVLPFPDPSLIFPKSTRWLLLVGCFIKIYFPASR